MRACKLHTEAEVGSETSAESTETCLASLLLPSGKDRRLSAGALHECKGFSLLCCEIYGVLPAL